MSKTLIILNPHAGSGRAGHLWTQIEPILWEQLGELVLAVTQHPEEVALHLDKAYASGLRRVISIGGDGTNHALVNALAALNASHPDGPPMVYGNLPVGTGRDWARSHGIPFDIKKAAYWIAHATPRATDIGLLQIDDLQNQLHFLNIASTGLGGEVDRRVNSVEKRFSWTFLKATVASILQYQPQPIRIQLDGQEWFDDKAMLAVVANGSTFGHGMKIAPDATTQDGLFDVVVVGNVSRLHLLSALRHVYTGTHLKQAGVFFKRAQHVKIVSEGGPLSLDLDGEFATGEQLSFQMRPGLLKMLL